MPGFVLLVRPRGDDDSTMRLGITVTRKIGGAVVRNRMKRRFRALAREVLPEAGVSGADHVLIGRSGGIERDFSAMGEELRKALRKISGSIVRPEPVEGLPFPSSDDGKKDRASVSPARREDSSHRPARDGET
ncbi:MAG: ribonuclease protein component [Sphingomonadales bacterium]|jgi:ribonuclease P protein component|nr:ribonuclease protein component [Sphingomonadales bacterium]